MIVFKNEKWLIQTIIFLLLVLVAAQTLMLKKLPRQYMSRVDKMEGEQISFDLPLYASTNHLTIADRSVVSKRLPSIREGRIIVIRQIKPASSTRAFITVNGELAADFRKGDVKLTVYDGDYVEIDASMLSEASQFIVNVPGAGLASPADGLVVECLGSITSVGKIKFR